MAPKASAARAEGPWLELQREFAAPREMVFQAWSSVELVRRWWGPHDYSIVACDWDFRVGGTWRIGIRAPTGEEHWMGGVFRAIDPPSRIVFSFDWERPGDTEVTVEFVERGDKTHLTFRHGPFPSTAARDSAGVWSQVLEKLGQYVATHGAAARSR